MGLGKTVMLMSLILKAKHERGTRRPTLVVAKLSLLPQWEDELATKTNLTHRVHYGQSMVTKTDLSDVVRLLRLFDLPWLSAHPTPVLDRMSL
jgi:SNF2 family DNA or RNA helicase